jgi:hypothetical protein
VGCRPREKPPDGFGIRIQSGAHGPYQWLEADCELREFLSLCPDAIVGSHIAVTAVDSGSFSPSDEDLSAGWSASGGIAYSPAATSDCNVAARVLLPRLL